MGKKGDTLKLMTWIKVYDIGDLLYGCWNQIYPEFTISLIRTQDFKRKSYQETQENLSPKYPAR